MYIVLTNDFANNTPRILEFAVTTEELREKLAKWCDGENRVSVLENLSVACMAARGEEYCNDVEKVLPNLVVDDEGTVVYIYTILMQFFKGN